MAGSLRLIAAIAAVVAIWWSKILLVPLVLGALAAYMLDPLQRRLVAIGLPRRLAAGLILTAVVGAGAAGAVLAQRRATHLIQQLPAITDRVRDLLREGWEPTDTVGRVQQAATDLQRAAEDVRPSARGVPRVRLEAPGFQMSDLLWRGSISLVGLASQVTIVLFLIYYILASGDLYKRKIVRIAGSSLSEKRVTLEILNAITLHIEGFVRARIAISLIVGASTMLSFWLLGVSHPSVWGLSAAVLNSVPYLGPSAIAAAAAVDGLLQFGSGSMAITLAGVTIGIASAEGLILTPWLMGRAGHMSTGAVFVGLAFWGWIWGIWGFLLAAPILMATKVISDHLGWSVLSELLSE